MPRLYAYVGPEETRKEADAGIARLGLARSTRFRDILEALEAPPQLSELTVTFVLDAQARLWVADRHSEHVACARGGPVAAAGELTLARSGDGVEVLDATNQSTGYCPEPACWDALAEALDRIGFARPDGFTHAFVFRRCTLCSTNVVVKDGVFVCAECDAALPLTWNIDPPA